MSNLRKLSLVCLSLLFAVPTWAELSKEPMWVQIERMTVRLEMKNPVGIWISQGTGFFVQDAKEQLFIVTARHVVVGAGKLRARVPSLNTVTGKTEMVFLELPQELWTLGRDDDKDLRPIDVAVMKLGNIKDRRIVALSYCPTNCPQGISNQIADDPHSMDQIIILGFPLDLGFTLKEQRPMVRTGIVSLSPDEPFFKADQDPRYLRKNVFTIDCHLFPGNSGGPVLVTIPFQPVRLGGLVTAGNPQLEYGIVTPPSQIKEVLDDAAGAKVNMDAWFAGDPDAPDPVPVPTK
jgi:S1-C subfamily serine protease